MKMVLAFATLLCFLAACAPAAGRPALRLQGTTQDMVSAAAASCPTIAPAGYNYLSVENIGDTSVSCVSSETTSVAVLGALLDAEEVDQRVIVSFSQVSDTEVQVAISSSPQNEDLDNQLQNALLLQFPAAE